MLKQTIFARLVIEIGVAEGEAQIVRESTRQLNNRKDEDSVYIKVREASSSYTDEVE